jgi:DNA-binding GntR family transcriptional regulator
MSVLQKSDEREPDQHGGSADQRRARKAGGRERHAGGTGVLEDWIFSSLRQMIVERELLPGERIMPDQVARTMAVSRTPVINALKRLSQARLAEWIPHRGVFVRRYSKREMAEVFELREVLEGLMARRAATRISDEEIAYFREIFATMDTSLSPASVANFMARDREFHNRLFELAENDLVYDAARFISHAIFAMGLIRTVELGVREHLDILDALESRDPKRSEECMRAHIHRSVEWLTQEAAEEDRQRSSGDGKFWGREFRSR